MAHPARRSRSSLARLREAERTAATRPSARARAGPRAARGNRARGESRGRDVDGVHRLGGRARRESAERPPQIESNVVRAWVFRFSGRASEITGSFLDRRVAPVRRVSSEGVIRAGSQVYVAYEASSTAKETPSSPPRRLVGAPLRTLSSLAPPPSLRLVPVPLPPLPVLLLVHLLHPLELHARRAKRRHRPPPSRREGHDAHERVVVALERHRAHRRAEDILPRHLVVVVVVVVLPSRRRPIGDARELALSWPTVSPRGVGRRGRPPGGRGARGGREGVPAARGGGRGRERVARDRGGERREDARAGAAPCPRDRARSNGGANAASPAWGRPDPSPRARPRVARRGRRDRASRRGRSRARRKSRVATRSRRAARRRPRRASRAWRCDEGDVTRQ